MAKSSSLIQTVIEYFQRSEGAIIIAMIVYEMSKWDVKDNGKKRENLSRLSRDTIGRRRRDGHGLWRLSLLVTATGLNSVSDWWPAACCYHFATASIPKWTSSSSDFEAFLREPGARVVEVPVCLNDVLTLLRRNAVVTQIFSLSPGRDIKLRVYVKAGYSVCRVIYASEKKRERDGVSMYHGPNLCRAPLQPQTVPANENF